jgi:hypothetical protein
MLRMGLLTSTAMTAVTLLLSGAPSPAHGQPLSSGSGRDRNHEFLCTYGQFDVFYSHSANSGSGVHTAWTHVAVPVTGHGKLVHRIVVQEGKSSKSVDGKFSAGIYSNTASGLPGNLIAGGAATASSHCTEVGIPINPTKLQDKKTYWIVEQARQQGRVKRKLHWAVNPKTKQKAYVQRYNSSSFQSHTSPWMEQALGPWVKLQ